MKALKGNARKSHLLALGVWLVAILLCVCMALLATQHVQRRGVQRARAANTRRLAYASDALHKARYESATFSQALVSYLEAMAAVGELQQGTDETLAISLITGTLTIDGFTLSELQDMEHRLQFLSEFEKDPCQILRLAAELFDKEDYRIELIYGWAKHALAERGSEYTMRVTELLPKDSFYQADILTSVAAEMYANNYGDQAVSNLLLRIKPKFVLDQVEHRICGLLIGSTPLTSYEMAKAESAVLGTTNNGPSATHEQCRALTRLLFGYEALSDSANSSRIAEELYSCCKAYLFQKTLTYMEGTAVQAEVERFRSIEAGFGIKVLLLADRTDRAIQLLKSSDLKDNSYEIERLCKSAKKSGKLEAALAIAAHIPDPIRKDICLLQLSLAKDPKASLAETAIEGVIADTSASPRNRCFHLVNIASVLIDAWEANGRHSVQLEVKAEEALDAAVSLSNGVREHEKGCLYGSTLSRIAAQKGRLGNQLKQCFDLFSQARASVRSGAFYEKALVEFSIIDAYLLWGNRQRAIELLNDLSDENPQMMTYPGKFAKYYARTGLLVKAVQYMKIAGKAHIGNDVEKLAGLYCENVKQADPADVAELLPRIVSPDCRRFLVNGSLQSRLLLCK
jgi:hypothetical protein